MMGVRRLILQFVVDDFLGRCALLVTCPAFVKFTFCELMELHGVLFCHLIFLPILISDLVRILLVCILWKPILTVIKVARDVLNKVPDGF